MRFSLRILVCCAVAFALHFPSKAQTSHELGLLLSPIEFTSESEPGIFYRWNRESGLSYRAQLTLSANTNKELRNDTMTLNEGLVQYGLAIGVQQKLPLGHWDRIFSYAAIDGYWNSRFSRPDGQDYYGYFFDFGFTPVLGVSMDIFE